MTVFYHTPYNTADMDVKSTRFYEAWKSPFFYNFFSENSLGVIPVTCL